MKIKIPTDIKEIRLRDYQKFQSILEHNEDENFISQKMVEIFCEVSLSKVAQMSFKDVMGIVGILNDAFNTKREFRKTFELNGVKYGFIPDMENISMGEFIDLDTYIKEPKDLHKLMSVLYRPITTEKNELYQIEEYNPTSNIEAIMRDAPLDVALEAQLFFYHLGNELLNSMADYLAGEKMTIQEKQTLEEHGVGIRAFTQSLKEIYSTSKKLQPLTLEPA